MNPNNLLAAYFLFMVLPVVIILFLLKRKRDDKSFGRFIRFCEEFPSFMLVSFGILLVSLLVQFVTAREKFTLYHPKDSTGTAQLLTKDEVEKVSFSSVDYRFNLLSSEPSTIVLNTDTGKRVVDFSSLVYIEYQENKKLDKLLGLR